MGFGEKSLRVFCHFLTRQLVLFLCCKSLLCVPDPTAVSDALAGASSRSAAGLFILSPHGLSQSTAFGANEVQLIYFSFHGEYFWVKSDHYAWPCTPKTSSYVFSKSFIVLHFKIKFMFLFELFFAES